MFFAVMATRNPSSLIIEDDPAAAEALLLILRDWGAEVLHGASGDAVAAACAARHAELRWIITDFHLGDGPDGVTLVQAPLRPRRKRACWCCRARSTARHGGGGPRPGFEVMQKPARAKAIVAWLERA